MEPRTAKAAGVSPAERLGASCWAVSPPHRDCLR